MVLNTDSFSPKRGMRSLEKGTEAGGEATTTTAATMAPTRSVSRSLRRCSGWHSLVLQAGSYTLPSLLGLKDLVQLAATGQAGAVEVEGGAGVTITTATTTHHHHTTTQDLAQNQAMAQRNRNSNGGQASGLALLVELLLHGRPIAGAIEATRLAVVAGGITEVEAHGITVVREVRGLRRDHRASRAQDMRAQASARLRAGRAG